MTFNDLEEDAKEHARATFRELGCHDGWWEAVYEDAVRVGAILGIEIDRDDLRFSGFSSQGDGASYTGHYRYESEASKLIREYAPEDATLHWIADELTSTQVLVKLAGYEVHGCSIHRSNSFYCHSGTMQVQFEGYDGPIEDVSDEFSESQSKILRLLRNFADWIYAQLETEYDHVNSDEYIDEQLADLSFSSAGEIL